VGIAHEADGAGVPRWDRRVETNEEVSQRSLELDRATRTGGEAVSVTHNGRKPTNVGSAHGGRRRSVRRLSQVGSRSRRGELPEFRCGEEVHAVPYDGATQ
jgi:hypothetical protein